MENHIQERSLPNNVLNRIIDIVEKQCLINLENIHRARQKLYIVPKKSTVHSRTKCIKKLVEFWIMPNE